MSDGSAKTGGDSTALIGSRLAGKYEILSLVGEGGMGAVFKASHLLMKGFVAIKMMHSNMAEPAKLKRFQQEAQATFRLSHPNIIRVLDFGVSDDGRPYLVMDFLEGKSLADAISEQGRVPVDRVIDIMVQACDGLNHAHAMGIVHRDLKPSNIMLVQTETDWDSVRIVDFGIAKIVPLEGEELHRLTQTGEVFGSPYYMSPEQCLGQEPDRRSDIYSLGCVLYEALVGQPPFKSNALFETFSKHLKEMPPAISIPGCDRSLLERLDAIVFRAMEKSADKRYQTMAEMKSDLEDVRKALSGGAGFSKSLSGGFKQMFRQVRRQIAAHPLLAIVLLVLLVTAPTAAELPSAYAMLTRRGPNVDEMPWQKKAPPVRAKPADYEDSDRKTRHYIQMLRRGEDPGKFELIRSLTTQAAFYCRYGEWLRAAQTYQEIRSVYEAQSGSDNLPYADACERFADCLYEQGMMKEALTQYELSLRLSMKGGDRPQVGKPLSRVADILFTQGDLTAAESKYKEALRIWSTYGHFPAMEAPGNADVALSCSKLADIERLKGEYSQAEAGYKAGLRFWEIVSDGAERVNQGLSLDRLGIVCEKEGKFQEADGYYNQSFGSLEKTLGPADPYLATVLQQRADLLWKEKRWWEAIQLKLKAADVLKASLS